MQAKLYAIKPFDALVGGTIKFSWYGNQVFKNRCIIRKNETNEIVYDKLIDSFKDEHPIDLTRATLVNGEKYIAFITVFDKNNLESDLQQLGEVFLCLKTASFSFTNASEGQVVSATSYAFSLSYLQANGELLDSWSVSLYTKSHSLLATSGAIYDTSSLSHTFSGFTDKNEYSIRAIGKTINGLDVDTGYINLFVAYSVRDVFSLLDPTNLKEIGAIQIRSNIVSSEGHSTKPVIYIDNEAVDLRDNSISYTEGFKLKGDFSVVKVFYNAKPNKEFCIMSAVNPDALTLHITYRVGKFLTNVMQACYELRATSYGAKAVYYSPIIDLPTDTDNIGVYVLRKNGLYSIDVKNLRKVI